VRPRIYTTALAVLGLAVGLGAGCVGPDPIFRFQVMTGDDAGSGSGNGGSSPTGAGGSTGAGGVNGTGHGGSGPVTGAGGSGKGGSGGGAAGAGGGAPGGAPGTVLLMDDFEGNGTAMWAANVSSEWSIVTDGTTHVEEVMGQSGNSSPHANAAGIVSWTDVAVEAKVKVVSFGSSSTSYFAGPCVRFASLDNYYCAAVRSDGKLAIRARLNGSGTSLATAPSSVTVTTGTWYTVKIVAKGTTITVFLNGTQQITTTDSTIPAGGIALTAYNGVAEFDDVVATVP
jgi:hypothetical protein